MSVCRLGVPSTKYLGVGELERTLSPPPPGSHAPSQYWDSENWLWGEDLRISVPRRYSEILGPASFSSAALGYRDFGKSSVDI